MSPASETTDNPTPRPQRRRDVLRLGRVALPVAAVAWGLSIAVHAGVLAVVVAVLRPSDAPPRAAFARGDGGTTFSVFRVGAPGVDSAGVPPAAGASGAPPAPAPAEDAAAAPEAFDYASLFPPTEVLPSLEPDETVEGGFIGMPPSDSQLPGRLPNRAARGAGGADVAGGTGPSNTTGAAAGPSAEPPHGGEGATEGPPSEGTPGVPGGTADARLPAPIYPRESRLRGEQGTVVLEVDVSDDGRPLAVRVADDAGYPRLAAAAVAAAKKAHITPARRDGKPVPATVRIPFRFTLRGTTAPRPG